MTQLCILLCNVYKCIICEIYFGGNAKVLVEINFGLIFLCIYILCMCRGKRVYNQSVGKNYQGSKL